MTRLSITSQVPTQFSSTVVDNTGRCATELLFELSTEVRLARKPQLVSHFLDSFRRVQQTPSLLQAAAIEPFLRRFVELTLEQPLQTPRRHLEPNRQPLRAVDDLAREGIPLLRRESFHLGQRMRRDEYFSVCSRNGIMNDQ